MYFRTEGVVIAKKNFGEADRILKVYTRDFGKVTCLVKGVRRPRSKKAGHVELGNWAKMFIAKGKNIDLLTEVSLKRPFGIADFTEEKANKIYHILELIDVLTPEKQKNLDVFIILVQFLKKASDDEDFNLVSSAFKVKLLASLGFFSSKNFKDGKAKKVLSILENDDFEKIRSSTHLTSENYLKLIRFLDSMIEKIVDDKLKTSRFVKKEVN